MEHMTPSVELAMGLGLLAALMWFAVARGARFLHYFQQEEYDGPRFIRWLIAKFAADRRLTLWVCLYFPLWALRLRLTDMSEQFGNALDIALAAWPWLMIPVVAMVAAKEENPARAPKKPLVWTARAKRIYRIYILLVLASAALVALPDLFTWCSQNRFGGWRFVAALTLWAQSLPLQLVIANWLLWPVEKLAQAGYYREAQKKLAHLQPAIIGITGSFGKTSTKHILGHILSSVAPTLMTPGSVNTLMGVTRIVREQLKPEHRFFIVEMGAYGPGSIARLCRLAPPQLAAITAVGAAHYERFKSLAQVARAKFEIAEAAWKQKGSVVLNATQIDAALLDAHLKNHGKVTLVDTRRSSFARPDNIFLHDVVQTAHGLNLKLTLPDGQVAEVETPLYGAQHATNIAVAVGLALDAGLPLPAILLALKTVPQTKHRLEVKRIPGQPVMIDDAYNSNPAGFAAALDILELLGQENLGRRILVTPGMTELGKLHKEEHRRLGQLAARKADWIIAVAPQRIPSFVAGVQEGGGRPRLDLVPDLTAARALLRTADLSGHDIVLYENDLPELYEARPRF